MYNVYDSHLRWTDSLKHLAITTRRIRIGNVKCFLKFLQEAELPEVKASRKSLQGSLFTLQSQMKKSRRDFLAHRQDVRIRKSSKSHVYWNVQLFKYLKTLDVRVN